MKWKGTTNIFYKHFCEVIENSITVIRSGKKVLKYKKSIYMWKDYNIIEFFKSIKTTKNNCYINKLIFENVILQTNC